MLGFESTLERNVPVTSFFLVPIFWRTAELFNYKRVKVRSTYVFDLFGVNQRRERSTTNVHKLEVELIMLVFFVNRLDS